jgi:hypothetical protein
MVEVRCPHCGLKRDFPESSLGDEEVCPACTHLFIVGRAGAPAEGTPATKVPSIPPAPEPRRWPLLVGTLTIVLAGIPLLQLSRNVTVYLAARPSLSRIDASVREAVVKATGEKNGNPKGAVARALVDFTFLRFWAPGAVALAAAVAGLGVLLRRRVAARACLVCAPAWIVLIALQAHEALRRFHSWTSNGSPFQTPPGPVYVAVAFDVALLLDYPVFILVWFIRPTVRAQVRQWFR